MSPADAIATLAHLSKIISSELDYIISIDERHPIKPSKLLFDGTDDSPAIGIAWDGNCGAAMLICWF